MSTLTYLMQAVVDGSKREIDGKTLTRPFLLIADANTQLTYGVDVDIGLKQVDPNTAEEVVTPLRNVPIASGSHEIVYADAGTAVRLRRSDSGRYEVVGFTKRMPGNYTRYGIQIAAPSADPIVWVIDEPIAAGLSSRPLTFEELGTIGPGFGITPFGAYGLFRGDVLVEIRV